MTRMSHQLKVGDYTYSSKDYILLEHGKYEIREYKFECGHLSLWFSIKWEEGPFLLNGVYLDGLLLLPEDGLDVGDSELVEGVLLLPRHHRRLRLQLDLQNVKAHWFPGIQNWWGNSGVNINIDISATLVV